MGLLLFTLTICGLVLHSWLIIEIRLNEFAFVKSDKIVNPMKNTFGTNLKYFHLYNFTFFH